MKMIKIIEATAPFPSEHQYAAFEALIDGWEVYDKLSPPAKVVFLTWSPIVDFISTELKRGQHSAVRK